MIEQIKSQASEMLAYLESVELEGAEFRRFEYSPSGLEFIFYSYESGFSTIYATGDTFDECFAALVRRVPSKETRQLNAICEHLAKIEGMGDKIESLAIRKIVADITKTLDDTRKYISDMREDV